MKKLLILSTLILFSSGCATRSISNTGYGTYEYPHTAVESNEMDELTVLGIDKYTSYSEEEIDSALKRFNKLTLDENSSLLVVQSGTSFPDAEFISSLSKHWHTSPASGDRRDYEDTDTHQLLRYQAARGGNDMILAYWGIVESADKHTLASQVSWIPIVGWGIPDKQHKLRVRLKLALIDVRTGNWQTFQTAPVDSEFASSLLNRKSTDQEKVIALKQAVYQLATKEIKARFSGKSS